MAVIDRVQIRYSQEGNSLGTTDDFESIEINFETQLPGEEPFVVLRTNGWSIDSVDELTELIDNGLSLFKRNK